MNGYSERPRSLATEDTATPSSSESQVTLNASGVVGKSDKMRQPHALVSFFDPVVENTNKPCISQMGPGSMQLAGTDANRTGQGTRSGTATGNQ